MNCKSVFNLWYIVHYGPLISRLPLSRNNDSLSPFIILTIIHKTNRDIYHFYIEHHCDNDYPNL